MIFCNDEEEESMDIEDLKAPELTRQEWDELSKPVDLPVPPATMSTESTIIDTNLFLNKPDLLLE